MDTSPRAPSCPHVTALALAACALAFAFAACTPPPPERSPPRDAAPDVRTTAPAASPDPPSPPSAGAVIEDLARREASVFWPVQTSAGAVCRAWRLQSQRGGEGELVGAGLADDADACVSSRQSLRYVLRADRIALSFDAVYYARRWSPGLQEDVLCGGEARTLLLGPARGERLLVGDEPWFLTRGACEAALERGERLGFPGFPCLAGLLAEPAKLDRALAGRLPPIDTERLHRYAERLDDGRMLYWLHGENVDPLCVEAKSVASEGRAGARELVASWSDRGAVRTYRYAYTFSPGCPRLRDVQGDLVLPPGAPLVGVGGKEPLDVVLDEALPGNTDRRDAMFLTRGACEAARKEIAARR